MPGRAHSKILFRHSRAAGIVGNGPKLRLQSGNPVANAKIEAAWQTWSKAVGLSAKLRTMCMAKTGDGEAFALVGTNPRLADPVQLDVELVECDQITTPNLTAGEPGRVDGMKFDEWSNPETYDLLSEHPGSPNYRNAVLRTIDAQFILHWYRADRPGQHRGVPEITPSLNLFGQGRRFREATIAAAETAADFAIIFKTQGAPDDGPDLVAPLSTLPIDKRMAVAAPMGWDAAQMRAEHPATTCESFGRSILREEARCLNLPYNIAAADSSSYNYSSGRLDHGTYFLSVDVERNYCGESVLDKLFALWYAEASRVYGWASDATLVPKHCWDWPKMPEIDRLKTANARKVDLSCGATTLREIAAEDGVDFEERLQAMAEDYGVSVEVMRAKLFEALFQSKASPLEDGSPSAAGKGEARKEKTDGQTQAA